MLRRSTDSRSGDPVDTPIRAPHPAWLIGLLALDAAPAVIQWIAIDPVRSRSCVVLLVIPTVVAACRLTLAALYGQVVIAVGVSAAVLGAAPDDRGSFEHVMEIVLVAGVLIAAAVLVHKVSSATAHQVAELRRLALTDNLTGVLNRRGLADAFRRMVSEVRRNDSPIGVVSLDIDHFKWFNDEYGHTAGDDVLRSVCRVLQQAVGNRGLVARTGGEEFSALVVGPAEPVAEQIRAGLAALTEPRVTASIGILDSPAAECADAAALWQVLDCADRAMYEAKRRGRDRICRGERSGDEPVRPPAAPVPTRAAIAAPPVDAVAESSALPGWTLALFGLLGVVTGLVRHGGDDAAVGVPLYMPIMVVCLAAGAILVGMGPLVDRFRWFAGIAGTDVVILLAVLDLSAAPARIHALVLLLVPGLMVGQHFGRAVLTAHHAFIVAMALLASGVEWTGSVLASALLSATVLVGVTELVFRLQIRNALTAESLHRWSVTDPLTGLANRNGLELGFENLSRAEQLTVLIIDVDDFKGINDRHGHAAGDDALIRLAATLRTVSSAATVIGRTGGDEFVLLAPAVRPSALTSRVQRAAALLPLPLSVSVGTAVAAPHRLHSLWQLVDAADSALIRAKRVRRLQRAPRRYQPSAGASAPSVLMDNAEGSAGSTSTRTVSPSVTTPESSSRAS